MARRDSTAEHEAAPAAAAGGASEPTHDPLGPFGDFLPWILYWVLVGNLGFRATLALAAGLALALLVVRRLMGAPTRTLNVGGVAVFAVLLGLAFVVDDAFLERWLQPLSNLGLLLVVLGGMAVGRPFVMDYARGSVSSEMAATPGFLWLNQRFTAIWAVAFAVMTVSAFVPPLIEGDATIKEGGSPLSIAGYWVVPYLALGVAALVNVVLVKGIQGPDADAAQIDEDRPGTGLAEVAGEPTPADQGPLVSVASASMVTDDLPVTVSGVAAGASVELELQLTDALNRRFVSRATFSAPDGVVDTSRHAPVDGDWAGVDPNAAVWAAQWDEEGPPQLFLPSWGPMHGLVTATVDGRVGRAELVRHGIAPGVTVAEVREGGVVGRLFLPAGPAATGVVLVGGSEGGIDSMSANASSLASQGVAALVVGLFGAEGLPTSLDLVPLEPIAAGVSLLAERAAVDPSAISLLGISRGAEAVLAAAAELPGLRCASVVALSPGSTVWESMTDDGSPTGRSSWTVGGSALPFAPIDSVAVDRDLWRTAVARIHDRHAPRFMHLRAAYEGGLAGAEAEAAAIGVERIDAPLHLFAGAGDALWPSVAMGRRIVDRRQEHGHGTDELTVFDGAGHLLRMPLIPVRPFTTGPIDLGGEPAGHAAAQAALGRMLPQILSPRP
ncbi:acyl-CoA thioester hydrolase/BAAT C-terminal domain-containing protein [Rhabdothermincola salaria]|uniref:acyl-CoA thioester hydrolase/BAAT C-terminal domain-containing protein n=1 Tax=Rhabdothermincola salaria TaxID=2903142 RepID=UPI001E47DD1C|nr:acyl-CoA thioester hydrolase/BAAT C-terminal domain-containing protein [Rhabdothermincola salaria]MCD9623609.1 acyl-CoA thioesterase/BAAT N-terminal domain-containing protein [Rhabdothermincola salaria]